MVKTVDDILDYLESLFPDAQCELLHQNNFQLLVAVVLSAQTTDKMVNNVTPKLFAKYPDAYSMQYASYEEVEQYIQTIGLYKNKAKMIVELAKQLVEQYDGEVVNNFKKLTALPGVGRKTANVVLSVAFNHPAIAVDTHVNRIAKRLGLAKFSDSVEKVEIKLKRKISRNRWSKAHHLFIFFGRYFCKASKPNCHECQLKHLCRKDAYQKYLVEDKL